MPLRVYYAHAMCLYGTALEKAEMLAIAHTCPTGRVNPGTLQKDAGKDEGMLYWFSLVDGCDALVFLIQGEGCIQSIYQKKSDSTYLELHTAMTDAGPINRLSGYLGLPPPMKPSKNHNWKPLWRKNIAGLRVLRVLREVLPHLVGQKEREARKALEFFGPHGYHRGEFRNGDVWPRHEFPLRSKKRGTNSAVIANQMGLTAEVPRATGHGRGCTRSHGPSRRR